MLFTNSLLEFFYQLPVLRKILKKMLKILQYSVICQHFSQNWRVMNRFDNEFVVSTSKYFGYHMSHAFKISPFFWCASCVTRVSRMQNQLPAMFFLSLQTFTPMNLILTDLNSPPFMPPRRISSGLFCPHGVPYD